MNSPDHPGTGLYVEADLDVPEAQEQALQFPLFQSADALAPGCKLVFPSFLPYRFLHTDAPAFTKTIL